LDVGNVHARGLLRLLSFVHRLGLGRQVAKVIVGVVVILLRVLCTVVTDDALERVDVEDLVGRIAALCSELF
jgi:hypothetical protein